MRDKSSSWGETPGGDQNGIDGWNILSPFMPFHAVHGEVASRKEVTGTISEYADRQTSVNVESFIKTLDEWEDGYWAEEEPLYYKLVDLSSDDRNTLMAKARPIEQIKYLCLLRYYAFDSEMYGLGLRDPLELEKTMDLMINDKKVAPLVRVIAEDFKAGILDYDEALMDGDFEPVDVDLSEENSLRKNFPQLSKDYKMRLIAPGVAKQGNRIAAKDGELLSLTDDFNPDNTFGIDKDTAFLINTVHDNDAVEEIIGRKLGIDLLDVSLSAQIHLLKFMTEADSKRFDKLCDTMHHVDEKLRVKLAENFVAADFGEDFGDSLLAIAGSEKLSNSEKEQLFDTMSACRESITSVTGLYEGYDDGEFAREYRRAANERLTDAIVVFEKIARDGMAEADLDWAGQPDYDYAAAIEALGYEAKALEIISEVVGDVRGKKEGSFAEIVLSPDDSQQRLMRTIYNFYSPEYGYVLLYTRPEGSHSFDPMAEYGKVKSRYDATTANVGVEASISFITNPVDPFSLPNPFRPDYKAMRNPRFYDASTMDKVSAIRLDREGRAPGMAADDPERDPINPRGMVSVDLAAIGDRADTPSGKIARLLSVGGKLRAEASGGETSLNHNTKWFDHEQYGTADGFRGLVEYIDAMATEWCHENKPDDGVDNFTKRKREASRVRGRKARVA